MHLEDHKLIQHTVISWLLSGLVHITLPTRSESIIVCVFEQYGKFCMHFLWRACHLLNSRTVIDYFSILSQIDSFRAYATIPSKTLLSSLQSKLKIMLFAQSRPNLNIILFDNACGTNNHPICLLLALSSYMFMVCTT